jgi:hypothetical protein
MMHGQQNIKYPVSYSLHTVLSEIRRALIENVGSDVHECLYRSEHV